MADTRTSSDGEPIRPSYLRVGRPPMLVNLIAAISIAIALVSLVWNGLELFAVVAQQDQAAAAAEVAKTNPVAGWTRARPPGPGLSSLVGDLLPGLWAGFAGAVAQATCNVFLAAMLFLAALRILRRKAGAVALLKRFITWKLWLLVPSWLLLVWFFSNLTSLTDAISGHHSAGGDAIPYLIMLICAAGGIWPLILRKWLARPEIRQWLDGLGCN